MLIVTTIAYFSEIEYVISPILPLLTSYAAFQTLVSPDLSFLAIHARSSEKDQSSRSFSGEGSISRSALR